MKTKTKRIIGTILIVLAIGVVGDAIGSGKMEQNLQKNIGFIVGYFGALAAMVIGGIVLCLSKEKEDKQ